MAVDFISAKVMVFIKALMLLLAIGSDSIHSLPTAKVNIVGYFELKKTAALFISAS